MSTAHMVDRDERTLAIENAGYRWAYLFMSYGLLAIVAYRGFMRNENAWDLMTLVVLGGLQSAAYQWFHKVLTPRWAATCLLTVLVACGVAALTVWLRR